MLNKLSISKKVIVGLIPMILLLCGYMLYSAVVIDEANEKLTSLKKHINTQASYGTSLFLLNNVNRRELLNQQYIISGKTQLIEIIKLLETDFRLLVEEQLKQANTEEKQLIQEIVKQEKLYSELLHQQLWPAIQQQTELLHIYNNDLGPNLEKLARIVKDLGVQQKKLEVTDIGSQLASSALAARAYFNEYIANKSSTSLERAKLELIAAQSALNSFTPTMRSDIKYSYLAIKSSLDQVEITFARGAEHVGNITKAAVQAEDLSSVVINDMLSQQISQWRKLDYSTKLILEFMTAFQWQSAIILAFALIAGIAFLLFISRLIVSSLKVLLERVSQISKGDGDLTKRIDIDSQDETGELAGSLNHFIDSVHTIVSHAQVNSSTVIDKSKQNLANATKASDLLAEQQQKNQLIATAIDELSIASNDIAQSSVQSSSEVESTFMSLERGVEMVTISVESVQQLNKQMETTREVSQSLAKETEAISNVLNVIKNMAEQTNLLALNAAIEAARAGEAGRGFTVVADEVRNLANRTHDSTAEIDTSIARLQKESQRVVDSVAQCYTYSEASADAAQETQNIFTQVRSSIEQVHQMSSSIATASEQQSQVTETIRSDVNEVFSFSESISLSAQESHAASKASTDSATELNQVLSKFTV